MDMNDNDENSIIHISLHGTKSIKYRTNVLAYNSKEFIRAVKGFIVYPPWGFFCLLSLKWSEK